MPTNSKVDLQAVGFLAPIPANSSSLGLNAAATWIAYGFVSESAKTLTTVRVFIVSVTGSLGANDLTCDIYNDTAGKPNTSIASTNTVSPAAAAGTWVTFTFSQALSAHTQYWIVLKNVNGTPASNFAAYLSVAGNTLPVWSTGSAQTWGWTKSQTVNSGTTWTTVSNSLGWRVGYSDGSFAGFPVQNLSAPGSGTGAFSTNEFGVALVTPANATWNVRGLAFWMGSSGSPPGNLRFRLYNNTTLLATTGLVPPANAISAGGWVMAYFSSVQPISGGTTVRVTAGVDTGGTSSNYYRPGQVYTVDSDSNSKQLMPFATAGSPTNQAKQTYYNGSSFTDTDTLLLPFAILLDGEGEFASVASGALLLNPSLEGM